MPLQYGYNTGTIQFPPPPAQVQLALEVYLAFGQEGAAGDAMAGFAAFTGTSDTIAMFSRKKTIASRVTKKPLFRFDSSRHAISVSSYMREQRDIELVGGKEGAESVAHGNRHFSVDQPSISQHVVCKPSNRNITGEGGGGGGCVCCSFFCCLFRFCFVLFCCFVLLFVLLFVFVDRYIIIG